MAVLKTGSTQFFGSTSQNPSAQSITVPDDATIAVVGWIGWETTLDIATVTLDSVSMLGAGHVGKQAVSGDDPATGIAWLRGFTTGAGRSLQWSWTSAVGDGGIVFIAFYKNDDAAGARDQDAAIGGSPSVTLDSNTTDAVFGFIGSFSGQSPDGAPGGSGQTVIDNDAGSFNGYAVDTMSEDSPGASTTTVSGTGSFPGLAALSIPLAPTAPLLSSSSPSDGDTGVSRTANVALTFDQNVSAGSGNIEIWNLTRGVLFETIPIGDGRVSISTTTVTVNPTGTFEYGADYAVKVASGVVLASDDSAPWAGISDFTTLNFRVTELTSAGTSGGLVIGSSTSFIGSAYIGSAESGGAGAITPSGITSAEGFGTASINQSVSPSGIATAEALGISRIDFALLVQALASAEGFGTPQLNLSILPSGVASVEAVPNPTVTPGAVSVAPSGITSAEAFGQPTMSEDVAPTGIASLENIPAPTVTPGNVNVAPSGIATGEVFGQPVMVQTIAPSGVASGEAPGQPTVNQSVSPSGIATGEQHGTQRIDQNIAPSGVASAETIGSPVVGSGATLVQPSAVSSAEAFGTPQVDQQIAPSGVTSGEAPGTPAVSQAITPTGIGSGEQHGTQRVDQSVAPGGIGSVEASGTPTVSTGAATIAPSGIASDEHIGDPVVSSGGTLVSPSGIASAEAFGTLRLDQALALLGIPSLESFGTPVIVLYAVPTGIGSGEGLGTPAVHQSILPSGVASAEQHGSTTVLPGGITVSPSGVASAEAFGQPTMGVLLIPPGVASLESVSVPALALFVSPVGVASLEQIGTVRVDMRVDVAGGGIASSEVLGTPAIGTYIDPAGLPTAEAFGAITIVQGGPVITVSGIPSSEAFGTLAVFLVDLFIATSRTVSPLGESRTLAIHPGFEQRLDRVQNEAEDLDYTVDLERYRALEDDETIGSVTWEFDSVLGTPAVLDDFETHSASSSDKVASVWCRKGTRGVSYKLTGHVTTSAARVFDVSFTVSIGDLFVPVIFSDPSSDLDYGMDLARRGLLRSDESALSITWATAIVAGTPEVPEPINIHSEQSSAFVAKFYATGVALGVTYERTATIITDQGRKYVRKLRLRGVEL